MTLIIGGACQGKLDFAKKTFGVTDAGIFICTTEKIDFAKRWDDTVNKVADEFDDLRRLIENYYSEDTAKDEEIQKATEKAFKDLIYIYPDLSW